jgi:lipocalin
MIKICFLILALSMSLTSINAMFKPGSCPQFTNATNSFEIENFMGPWFEIARTADIEFEEGECVNANLTLSANQTVSISILEIIEGDFYNTHLIAKPSDLNLLRFRLTSSNRVISSQPFALDFQILATDYDNYAYIYSCRDVDLGRNEYFWIFLRRDSEYQDLLEQALKFLADNYDVNRNDLFYRGIHCPG